MFGGSSFHTFFNHEDREGREDREDDSPDEEAVRLRSLCNRHVRAANFLIDVLLPQGTFLNRESDGHLFFQNFLSDLGMPRSWGGDVNSWGAALFVSAEVILAIGLISFFVGVLHLWNSIPTAKHWGGLGATAGVLASLVLVAAAFTPANRLLTAHVEMVVMAFCGATLAAICLVLALARDRRFPRPSLAVAVLVAVVVGGYTALIEWGPTVNMLDGLIFQVTAQKITFAVLLLGIAYLTFVAERVTQPH